MTTLDDWPRVKRVLEGALACDVSVRPAYLADACGADAVLRARVDRLLAADDRVATFLETPAFTLLEPQLHEDLSGRVAGSYQLVSRVGAGGMGEVYLAHDTRLDRPVALKFLSPDLVVDRHRLQQFHQEARAASSLNHPHIVVVHDFGELEGRPYIVTEFIEGQTLRQRLQQGPLPAADVIEIGIQTAGALGAAHARGLVHRDVKPENVMLRPDGYAKVLDFGLATLATATQPSDTIAGTPRYMSPEQARGLELDARSDVWSLGVVLHEMATGRLPSVDSRNRHLPPELVTVIGRALQTDRQLRHANAAELCADLRRVQGDSRTVRRGAWLGRHALTLTALVVLTVGVSLSVLSMRGSRGTGPGAVRKVVAVLPFDNVADGRDLDYLRLALADETATALSWTPALAVRPIAASRKFVDGSVSLDEAGRQLRAGEIVTGHFSTHESELRVTVEAVEVEGNRLLWRETIAAPTDNAIALRDRLTSRIRDGLLPALGTQAPAEPHGRPKNADAYAIYLRSLASSTDPEPNRQAIAMLRQASSLEPEYVDLWVSLADRYYWDGHYGGAGADALRESEAAARQALALVPDHTKALVRLFSLQVEAGRLQDGYDSALRLVRHHPGDGEARFALSYALRYGGLQKESARECDQAVASDPTNPLFRSCAQPFMQLGLYDRALDFVRLDAGSEWATILTRFIYQRMGRRADARAQHERQSPSYLRGFAPDMMYGLVSRCLAGDPPDKQGHVTAEDIRIFFNVREDPEPLYYWASDFAYCGHPHAAVQLLRESIRRNYCGASAMETDPAFAAIRGTPDYRDLLAAAVACRTRFREHVDAQARSPES